MVETTVNPALFESLKYRCIGPFRGGRVVAVAGHPEEQGTFYFGACAGGVWKTVDGGSIWENISDGFLNTSAIGAMAIAESDPNVIYIGTGETAIRGNVSHGDGVYKSTDGGKTWKNIGLADTRHISKVRIHPENPDIVYVAALGHAWGPNDERGVYRSTNGGDTWTKVLFVSDRSGAIDLAMDVTNPRMLYASFWEAQRHPHALSSGGPDSGIWKSTDGGDIWEDISRNPGLSEGTLGKIGVAVSPANPDRIWALVEAEDGALFRSDDAGETWRRICEQGDLRRRAWYYMHIIADPTDENTVWIMNLQCWKSVDGGRTFVNVGTPHGDNHDIWIDPKNPLRMVQGNDGGANVSYNGGMSWSTIENQPTAQFYHVIADDRHPYRVYGSQQDNTSLSVPSSSALGAITKQEWWQPGGGESGYIAIKPTNPDIIYGGAIGSGLGHGRLVRYDHSTFEERLVTVWPEVMGMGRGAESVRYRFQWTFPVLFSPHEENTLYVTSQYVHRSINDGHSWEVISPDLTRNDPEKLVPSGGPISNDNTGAEYYCTIFAFVESPLEAGVFWAGSDDGLIHLSKDGGNTWENVTPPASVLPEWALISIIEASPHDAATAYVAATRYKHDDNTPYLLKTTDNGKSWQVITDGIPADDFTRTIRADPNREDLLYAGTETGLYISFDDGENWQPFQLNLPVTPIHDLIIKNQDLVVATHGRSFWILDDLSPLYQLTAEVEGSDVHLFRPANVSRFKQLGRLGRRGTGTSYGRISGQVSPGRVVDTETGETAYVYLDAGSNPPDGVVIHYYLADAPDEEVSLTILDKKGRVVNRYTSDGDLPPRPTKKAGANRFVWDMRYQDADAVEGASPNERLADALRGPVACPGRYSVVLEVGGRKQEQKFRITKDSRVNASKKDLKRQFKLLMNIRDKISETNAAINELRSVRDQVNAWSSRVDDDEVRQAADDIAAHLTEVEDALIQTKADDPRAFPGGLIDTLMALGPQIANADARPTKQAQQGFKKIAADVDEQLARLQTIRDEEITAFNALIREKDLPAVAD